MKEDNNIDKLFKDKFDNFTPKVNSQMWSNISNKIGNNLTSSAVSTAGASSIGKGTIITIAVACGIVGAVIALLLNKSDFEKKISSNETVKKQIQIIENKKEIFEDVFSSSEPMDNNDPIIKLEKNKKVKNLQIKDVSHKQEEETNKKQPSSIVQLFLSEKEDITNTSSEIKNKEEIAIETEEIEILELDNEKLTTTINSSSSGGYVPLVVTFEQSENVDSVHWNFGDGSEAVGKVVEHIFREADDYNVVVTITDNRGESASSNKIINVKSRCIISKIPNIFTPNADGINDLFYVVGNNIKDYTIYIHNLSGKLVYQSNDINQGWGGDDLYGKTLDSGRYVYIIKARGEDGTDLSNKGIITISR